MTITSTSERKHTNIRSKKGFSVEDIRRGLVRGKTRTRFESRTGRTGKKRGETDRARGKCTSTELVPCPALLTPPVDTHERLDCSGYSTRPNLLRTKTEIASRISEIRYGAWYRGIIDPFPTFYPSFPNHSLLAPTVPRERMMIGTKVLYRGQLSYRHTLHSGTACAEPATVG